MIIQCLVNKMEQQWCRVTINSNSIGIKRIPRLNVRWRCCVMYPYTCIFHKAVKVYLYIVCKLCFYAFDHRDWSWYDECFSQMKCFVWNAHIQGQRLNHYHHGGSNGGQNNCTLTPCWGTLNTNWTSLNVKNSHHHTFEFLCLKFMQTVSTQSCFCSDRTLLW